MSNEFTSVATSGGWSTNTVKPAWDLYFRAALNAKPACWQFIDVEPRQPTHSGDSVTLQIDNFYGEAAVTAAKSALTEEADVDSTKHPATSTVTLTPVERGAANSRTLKVANRSMVALDPRIADALADWAYKTHDEFLQDGMVAGTQVYYGGSAGSTGALVQNASDAAKALHVRKAKTKLNANQAEPRDGVFYVGLIHPNVVYDLRAETGAGSWRSPKEYTDPAEVYRGEFGEFEGVRFVQNARIRNATDGSSSARVYRTFILGKEALCKAVITEPEVRLGPTVDKLGRFRHIGWYSDLDAKIFRDLAIVRIESTTQAT